MSVCVCITYFIPTRMYVDMYLLVFPSVTLVVNVYVVIRYVVW